MKILIGLFLCFLSLSLCAQTKFTGKFTNGYKGSTVSFTLSKDGTTISDFIFNGHWRCGGAIEHITAGPDSKISVKNGVINASITEPENGGASAFKFSIEGTVNKKQAVLTNCLSFLFRILHSEQCTALPDHRTWR